MRDKGEVFFKVKEKDDDREFDSGGQADTEFDKPNIKHQKVKIRSVVLRKKTLISEEQEIFEG
jgi:hypothetical protein